MDYSMERSYDDFLPLPPVVEMPSEYPDEDTTLVPCSVCCRTFKPTSLERHEKVCEKLLAKNRKTFDSTKQRIEGTDIPKASALSEPKTEKSRSRWREKHQEFLKTIRAAKNSSDEDLDDGSPQRNIPSDYIKCPHCDRYFGPKAADRHISWCAEKKSRLPRCHTNEDVEATQRLKTRTKYNPPKPGQNGWRAPKKKDVISSIPPPNIGPNITPPGRLISPPPPTYRHVSPPPLPQRHWSPPLSPSRKGSSSLPPGPPRYGGSSSLGRAAGKQFSAMLQSVTGCSPGYGQSSGYGSSLYGSPAYSNFNRSRSLRVPRKRPAGGSRMARHRDLASDMLASVSFERSKRLEPEGDESHDVSRPREHFSYNKTEKEEINERKKEEIKGERKNKGTAEKRKEDNPRVLEEGVELAGCLSLTPDAVEDLKFSDEKNGKSLEEEVIQLANKLTDSNFYEIGSRDKWVKGEDHSSEDTPLNELEYESDFELDIPTEENFLKSSTSISGDDDNNEFMMTRPRSVHFEDECRNDFGLSSENDSFPSRNTSGGSNGWSMNSFEGKTNLKNQNGIDGSVSKPSSNLVVPKQKMSSLKISNKESVREILRKRREESAMTKEERDSRRRIRVEPPLPEYENSRSRSRSYDNNSPKIQKGNKAKFRSDTSRENSHGSDGSSQRRQRNNRKFNSKKNTTKNQEVPPVISFQEYTHFRSLAGIKTFVKEPADASRKQRPILKSSSLRVPGDDSARLRNVPYDPYSAAELQFQDLLGLPKSGVGLNSDMMLGSTGSLQYLGLKKHPIDSDYSQSKSRASRLRGLGSISLCSLGLDSEDLHPHDLKSLTEDLSGIESPDDFAQSLNSPVHEFDLLFASLSSEPVDKKYSPEYDQRCRSVGYPNNKSSLYSSDRKVPEGSYSIRSPSPTFNNYSSYRKSFSKETPYQSYQKMKRPTSDFKDDSGKSVLNSTHSNYGWVNSEQVTSPQPYSAYFGTKTQPEGSSSFCKGSFGSSTYDAQKYVRPITRESKFSQNRERLNDPPKRASSGSSTDSSLPTQSSPNTSAPSTKKLDNSIGDFASLPKFCYECGNKYPVNQAKFCCHCGVPRVGMEK